MIDLSGELSHLMKKVYYRNPDASKQWFGPRKLAKVIVKKSILPQTNVVCLVEFWRCDSLGVCFKRACSWCGSLFSTTGTSSWKFWDGDTQHRLTERVLLQQDNARSCTTRTILTKIQKLWGIELLSHPAYSPDLRLQITICFDPWPISCVEEISKTLKLWKWVSPNSSHQKPEPDNVAGK